MSLFRRTVPVEDLFTEHSGVSKICSMTANHAHPTATAATAALLLAHSECPGFTTATWQEAAWGRIRQELTEVCRALVPEPSKGRTTTDTPVWEEVMRTVDKTCRPLHTEALLDPAKQPRWPLAALRALPTVSCTWRGDTSLVWAIVSDGLLGTPTTPRGAADGDYPWRKGHRYIPQPGWATRAEAYNTWGEAVSAVDHLARTVTLPFAVKVLATTAPCEGVRARMRRDHAREAIEFACGHVWPSLQHHVNTTTYGGVGIPAEEMWEIATTDPAIADAAAWALHARAELDRRAATLARLIP